MTRRPEVHAAPDGDALARDAAAFVAERAAEAVGDRGRFTLAVSGGSTPTKLFDALARLDLPWDVVDLFQVDERVAPLGHPDRNLGDLAAHLLERVPIPWRNVHLMPVEAADLEDAAAGYAATLHDLTGGELDVVHLGLGDDGHTASWPPGDGDVDSWLGDVAITGLFHGRRRMTLTPGAVNRARVILWLVSGGGKAPMVARLLDGDADIPAGRVTAPNQVLYAEDDALAP